MTEQKPLIDEKHPQQDLFLCDVADAVLKDIMPQMEHPFYSLSKKPETTIRRYEHNGNRLEVMPSVVGLPTIYDKDILIYAISQLMAKINRGEKVSKRIRINTRELLMFANRGTSGKDYQAICQGITRLGGVQISTNIVHGDEEEYSVFGLIDSGTVRRKNGFDGRLVSVTIDLSDWVFNAIQKNNVLTLNRDYFRLRKPIERRIYELARKHCGQQKKFTIGLLTLHKKTGSQSNIRKFRHNIKEIAQSNHLPDYLTEYDQETDNVTFINRGEWWDNDDKPYPQIKNTSTYEMAKTLCPQGTDIYSIEQEWFDYWKSKGRQEIKNPDGAFIAFVSKKFHGND